MIGTGRVWGTSAISAPSVITISTPSRSAAPTTSSLKLRHLRLGSVPLSSRRSRSAVGAGAAISVFSGHSMRRVWPAVSRTVGRVSWKSKNSSGSILATTSESSDTATASSAVVAALAASFQPTNAATRVGERSSGGSPSQIKRVHTNEPNGSQFPSGPACNIELRGSRNRERRRAERSPSCVRASASRVATRACERTGSRPATGRRICRSSCATAAARSPRACSARSIASRPASTRGDAVRVRGRAERFRGELTAELDDVRRLDAGEFEAAEFLPAAYRSVEELEGFLEHLDARGARPGAARRGRRGAVPRAGGERVPARAVHTRRPPRLPRRA